MESYVIRAGKQGYERLLLLARDRWPGVAAHVPASGSRRIAAQLAASSWPACPITVAILSHQTKLRLGHGRSSLT
jgi:hypothetical protein